MAGRKEANVDIEGLDFPDPTRHSGSRHSQQDVAPGLTRGIKLQREEASTAKYATPAILLSNYLDEDVSELLVPSQQRATADGGACIERREGPIAIRGHQYCRRRIALHPHPNLTEVPEEDEEYSTDITECQQSGRNQADTSKDISTGHSASKHPSSATRKRAQSYPVEAVIQNPPVMLELITGPSENKRPATASPGQNEQGEKSSRLQRLAHLTIMAKKWKTRSVDVGDAIQQQNSTEMISNRQRNRPFVEVPRALKLDLLSEAYPMVQKMHKIYMSELGPHCTLTKSAKRHLERMSSQLGKSPP